MVRLFEGHPMCFTTVDLLLATFLTGIGHFPRADTCNLAGDNGVRSAIVPGVTKNIVIEFSVGRAQMILGPIFVLRPAAERTHHV